MQTRDVYVLLFSPEGDGDWEIVAVFETREAANTRMIAEKGEIGDDLPDSVWDVERHYLYLAPSLANAPMEPEKLGGEGECPRFGTPHKWVGNPGHADYCLLCGMEKS
jgi:hypothetical protein